MNDQVMFESYKTEGQFLHSSDRKFNDIGESLNSNWYVYRCNGRVYIYMLATHFPSNSTLSPLSPTLFLSLPFQP